MAEENRSEIDQAYEDIEREVPARVARAIKWLRDPEALGFVFPLVCCSSLQAFCGSCLSSALSSFQLAFC
jgi:hypothetical protein